MNPASILTLVAAVTWACDSASEEADIRFEEALIKSGLVEPTDAIDSIELNVRPVIVTVNLESGRQIVLNPSEQTIKVSATLN